MLKIVVLAMALATVIVAQVKFVPAEWTDACAKGECIVGP
jgi:hypothetical protein